MNKILFFLFFVSNTIFAQSLNSEIDEILRSSSSKSFNGIVIIQKGDNVIYKKIQGFSDLEKKIKLKADDRFVVGSISKQFAGAIVLQEIDAGRLDPQLAIKNYLPELTQKWADTVTAHHLITHLHGIRSLDAPTVFPVGTRYEYSQIGFELLSKIVEKTSGKSFAALSQELFEKCGLKNTSHPNLDSSRVKSYTESESGKLQPELTSLRNYVAAGAFISTAEDLLKWNKIFFSGELFTKESMQLLLTQHPVAIRNHPLFGETKYGYGITVDYKDGIVQYGQTGFAPGFVSMNFYYPAKDLSLVILSNVVWDENDLNIAFKYHMEIWNKVRKYVSAQ
jgi:D-alanyl-D-alanine carboxypeptidase